MIETQETESVISEAQEQIKEIRDLLRARNQNTLQLGKVLSDVKEVYEYDEENFTFHGMEKYHFQFFNQFLADIETATSTADRAIRLYRTFIRDLGMSVDIASRFNYTKLDVIQSVVTQDTLSTWLMLLEDKPIGDLRREVDKFKKTGNLPGSPEDNEPIETAITPETARDWLDSWAMLQQTIRETFVAPQDKKFIKDVFSETWGLFGEVLRRKARGTEFKRSSEKLIKVMDSIIKKA